MWSGAAPGSRPEKRSVHDHLVRLGGVAPRQQLVGLTSRDELESALADGAVLRIARGCYALPTAGEARTAAARLSGVATGRSAAAHWGWAMKWQPARPEIAVPRGRRVTADAQCLCSVSWWRLDPADVVDGWVLAPLPTLLDCLRTLPFDEGLAIADSALRSGRCSRDRLRLAADSSPERGHAAARRVARAADGRAANPFESVLRAIALDLPHGTGLTLVPQVRVDSRHTGRFIGRVDLADERLAVVAEADSFEFHGEAWQLDRDCRRYDELVVDGWLVLRFTWLQVMKQPEWVASMLRAAACRRRTELEELGRRTYGRPLVTKAAALERG